MADEFSTEAQLFGDQNQEEPPAETPSEAPVVEAPLETLIAKAAATGAGTLDDQFRQLARAQQKAFGIVAPGAAPGAPRKPQTWAEITQSDIYQQSSTERRQKLRTAWLNEQSKYATTRYAKKKDQDLYMEGVVEAVPSLKAPTRTIGETLNDVFLSFKSGVREIGGSIGGAVRPTETFEGDPSLENFSNFFNAAASNAAQKQYQTEVSAATKDAQLASQEREQAATAGLGKLKAVAGAIKDYPILGAMVIAQTTPSILATAIPAGVVGRAAKAAISAIGAAEESAAAWGARAGLLAGGGSAAVQGAGQARNEIVQRLTGLTEEQWNTDDEYVLLRDAIGPDAAKRAIAENRSILPGVIGAGLAGISGMTGLEKVLVGAAGKGIRSRLGALAAEEAGEVVEENAAQILGNIAEQKFKPEVGTFAGTERTTIETLVGAAPGAGVAAIAHPGGAEAQPQPAPPEGAPAAPEAPPAPAAPIAPPTSFRADVAQRVAALDERIRVANEDVNLTEDQRREVVTGIEAERADWLKAQEKFENTAPVTDARGEVEKLTNEINEIEQRPIDEDTKAKQIAARTTRIEELNSLLELNNLNENELEDYAKARRQALQDADVERGLGARGIDTRRLNNEINFADRLLLERALVETPTETAFAARARAAFPLDDSGNPVYPGLSEINNKDTRAALDVISDAAQSRIWVPRNNPTFTRAEKAARIRQARELATRIERARDIMSAPAEQLPQIRTDLIQSMVDVARNRGNFDQGRVTELAAVFAREADARGEKLTFGQAKERAQLEIQRLLMGVGEDPNAPPPKGAPPPAPAPGVDPGPGGKDVGYDVVGGWLIYNSPTPVTDGGRPAGRAPTKKQAADIVDQLRDTFKGGQTLDIKAVQWLNLRFVFNVFPPGTLGWYYPAKYSPWKARTMAIDIERQPAGAQRIHTAAHEVGHAFDDIMVAQNISVETAAFAPGSELRREIEAANSSKKLDFSYPLYHHYPETTTQLELFAQVIGYYHSRRQDLATNAPKAFAVAEEIVNGINQLAGAGQLDQQRVAETLRGALQRVGNAPGAPGAGPATGGAQPTGERAGGRGAGAGVAAAVRQPASPVLTAISDGERELQRQASLLGPESARASNTRAVEEAIRLTEREIAAQGAQPEAAGPATAARRVEPAAGPTAGAAAAPAQAARAAAERAAAAAPVTREGAGAGAEARAPEAAEAGRPAQGPGQETVSESRTESLKPGAPPSSPVAFRDALAQLVGARPESIGRIFRKVRFVLEKDVKNGKLTLPDKTSVTGIGDKALAGYDGKTNTIVIIADRVPKGWERAVLLHEVFHKRGAQLLGATQMERFRREFDSWRNAPAGSPERRVYDAASPRIKAAAEGKFGEKRLATLTEETLPYAIEEAAKLGFEVDPKAVLAKGVNGFIARFAQRVSDAWAQFTGRPPTKVTIQDLMAAAYGAAQLELTDVTRDSAFGQFLNRTGAGRAAAALASSAAFRERRGELRRGESVYTPERLTPAERKTGVRPSLIDLSKQFAHMRITNALRRQANATAAENRKFDERIAKVRAELPVGMRVKEKSTGDVYTVSAVSGIGQVNLQQVGGPKDTNIFPDQLLQRFDLLTGPREPEISASEVHAAATEANASMGPLANEMGSYASPAQAAAVAQQGASPPGPLKPRYSIKEIFSPKTVAQIKNREQLASFGDTLDLPKNAWFPQARDKFIENWVDHQRPFFTWLSDNVLSLKPWRELKLVPGKIRDRIERYGREMLDPINAKVNAFGRKHGLDSAIAAEVVGQWTTMRHIPEANAAIRDKLRKRVAAGERGAADNLRAFDRTQAGTATPEERAPMAGGLSDREAIAIREKLERQFGVDDLKAMGDDIVAAFQKLKEDSLKSGQLSPDIVKQFPKFQHYVALTGTPWDDSASDAFGSYVAPNLLREREGRDTVADPALVALSDRVGRVAAYEASVDFKRSLNELWEGAGGDKNAVGLKRFVANSVQRPETSDVIWQGDDGKRYVFRFDDAHKGIGEAILSKNREYADNGALRIMDRATRLFSRAVTQWTFAFAPVNSIRDIQEKSVLIRSKNVRNAAGETIDANDLFKRVWANYLDGNTWRAARQLAFGGSADNSTEAGRLANELVQNGGVSTWGQHLRRGRDEISTEVKKHSGLRKQVAGLDKFVSNYNLMMEVMSSLASHAAMRQMGVDAKEAAFQTLDLMNFQNQGSKTAWVRAMFSFFNPAMQSGTNLLRQVGTKRGFYDMLGLVALSTMLYTLSKATGDDDEELGNEIDQRGAFEAERSFTLKLGDAFVKLPIGFGLPQLAWAMAVNGSRYASGRYDAASATAQMGTSFLKTFSPIPPSEVEFTKQPVNFFLKSITPTIFKGAVDMATDTNAWGQKLTAFYPDRRKFQAEQGKPSTPVFFKEIADDMRKSTGIDLYPEQWRALLEGSPAGWGPMGYIMKSIADSNADMEGRKKDLIDQIPGSSILRLFGASRFVGGASRYLDARYHEQYDKALVDLREYNSAVARGEGQEWSAQHPERRRRVEALKNQESAMRGLSKDYNATIKALQGGTSDNDTALEQLNRIQDRRQAAMRAFLQANKVSVEEDSE